jgi:glycolate oxidase iron-sulfur subunit
MQTNFKKDQLLDPEIQNSEKIFRKCVHCGMCNATCPTYQILGDELDGPRGRIYLIKDMLENNKPANDKIVKHLDRCLSCYACVTTCPSGVDYMHLIDHGRNHIERTYKRPFFERLVRNMLAYILPKPNFFKLLAKFTWLTKPLHFLLPKKLKHMVSFMPKEFPKSEYPENVIFKPSKKSISKVALLTGCVQKAISPNINDASINVLLRHGIEVHVLNEIKCCGSLTHHMGKEDISHEYFIQNINAWYELYEREKIDAILVNTSGCGTTLKDYGFIFKNHPDKTLRKKAKQISELALDITEYLEESIKLDFTNSKNINKKYNIAYHSACSMQHGQKVHDQPFQLLKKTGNNIIEIPDGHLCCGSAGTYNLMQEELATELQTRKCENIKKVNPDIIAAGNIGCITQISNGINIPIVHTIELIDWFTGGKKPNGLNNL